MPHYGFVFAVIDEQEAAEDLAPRLEIILQHLMFAFGTYQVPMLAVPESNLYTLLNVVII